MIPPTCERSPLPFSHVASALFLGGSLLVTGDKTDARAEDTREARCPFGVDQSKELALPRARTEKIGRRCFKTRTCRRLLHPLQFKQNNTQANILRVHCPPQCRLRVHRRLQLTSGQQNHPASLQASPGASFLFVLQEKRMVIPGLPGGLIIYQGHLFPLEGHL